MIRRQFTAEEVAGLQTGKVYYARLTRLLEPEPQVVWEGQTEFHIQRRADGRLALITPKAHTWAEGSADDIGPDGAVVVEDYCMEVFTDVCFDPADRALVTHCAKCGSAVRLRLGGIADAATARRAVELLTARPGMCPPLETDGFAAWAHPELSFHGFWQAQELLALIDLLVEKGVLTAAPAILEAA